MLINITKFFAKLAIASVIFGCSIFFFIFIKYERNLPNHEGLKNYQPPVTTTIYSANGYLLNKFAKENRVFIPIKMIPSHVKNAFIAAEDRNFYNHIGIDFLAIFRATISNTLSLYRGNGSLGGASTITQQVVKNFLLTNEKTIERKIKEAILAFKITKTLSKDKVLELYLNDIYLGDGSYGVVSASKNYFNKSIEDISIDQAALLATLPKAPSKLNPRKNIEKAKYRRDWVLSRMEEDGFISNKEFQKLIEVPIILYDKEMRNKVNAFAFSDFVKSKLLNLYGSDNVFKEGIVVRTTLQPKLQKIAQKALQSGLEKYDIRHGYRGALGSIKFNEENIDTNQLSEDLRNFNIPDSYKKNWEKALVLDYSEEYAFILTENKTIGKIPLENVLWAKKYINVDEVGNKIEQLSDVFEIGDVILVEVNDISFVQNDSNLCDIFYFTGFNADYENNSDQYCLFNHDIFYELRQIPKVNGALMAINPHNGKILAMMGGYLDEENKFNRSVQAKRQPGSLLKAFGYLAAMESGLSPATVIMDEKITLDQGQDLPPYRPVNYAGRFYGPTTLRVGLEKSRNVTTVRMASQVGLEKIREIVERFGVSESIKPIYSMVLGSVESNLMKLVRAYAMIVNGGRKIEVSAIEKIQDRNGKVIYRDQDVDCVHCSLAEGKWARYFPYLDVQEEEVTDEVSAYQVTSILEGVVKRGTARRALSINRVIGGKTGTTNNSYDSWFVGFSPDLVVGVYAGFDIPNTLGKHESGSSVALPIFVDFMKEALAEVPSKPFRIPDGVKFIKIDRITGRYPNAFSKRRDIILEAFKEDQDVVEEFSEEEDLNYGEIGLY
jgi:penicillin-binding protein 1A